MIMDSIKDLFSPAHILHVAQMREKFFSTGSMKGITGVRSEILMGWKMSYESGFREVYQEKPVVHDLKRCQKKSEALMKIAVPYMEKILSFLDQKSFWLTLLNADGIILKLIGSPDTIDELRATGLIEGSDRGEQGPYCGLFHMVYTLKKPFILVSTEHASAIDDNLAGAACPIIDIETKCIIGYIAISGHWWDSHIHTLGLVILAAEAINQQLFLITANQRMKHLNELVQNKNIELDQTVEDIDFGIIYFDKAGRIIIINTRAIRMLGLRQDKKTLIGTNIRTCLDGRFDMDEVYEKTNNGIEYSSVMSSVDKDGSRRRNRHSLYITVRLTQISNYIMRIKERQWIQQSATRIVYNQPPFQFENIIGTSEAMQKAKNLARIAAPHDTAVMILGESGTGKEMFAQAIHNASGRSDGPFIAINCGAIPRTLIESELFGYERGAFTGADKNGHPGKFELANGGTLFLDEIGDMAYDVQVSLLRVLQSKEVLRLGSRKPIKIDVRIISATNQDLEEKIRNHTFRDDLYYRLNVFSILLPPLRERYGDIEQLANFFLDIYSQRYGKSVCGFSPEALHVLNTYSWPGNIRQLENTVERALLISQDKWIEETALPLKMQQNQPENTCYKAEPDTEKDGIYKALQKYDFNVTQAAKLLGISRPTLYKKMKQYHIEKNKIY